MALHPQADEEAARPLGSSTPVRTAIVEDVLAHLSLGSTILLDALLILLAIGCRAGLLWVLHHATPPDTRNWAIAALEWIADIGMVGTALAYTAFDLSKRLIRAVKGVYHELKS